MSVGATSLGLAERLLPSIGGELRAVVLRCLPYVDTQDVAVALGNEDQPLFLGGSLEIIEDRQGSLHLSWKQEGREFGLFGSPMAWNEDFASDRLAATNYPPWQALLGARLIEARTYVFPESAKAYVNALELTFEADSERSAVWVWTGTKSEALPFDDVIVSLNIKPSNVTDMLVQGTAS